MYDKWLILTSFSKLEFLSSTKLPILESLPTLTLFLNLAKGPIDEPLLIIEFSIEPVSYTHLTLPTKA